jgi:prepilin-type N-terminal cleavage/methylation domain-containing protein
MCGSHFNQQAARTPSFALPHAPAKKLEPAGAFACPASMQTRHAFTLVEVLVVIAIIALLAALLLPALSRAKNQAGKATDLNNLKQVMLATHLYAEDTRDVLPLPNWDNGGPLGDGHVHAGWLYAADVSQSAPQKFKAETGLLWNTLGQPKTYLCPMDDPKLARWSQLRQQVMSRPQQLSSYALNGSLTGQMFGWNHPEVPAAKIAQMHPDDCGYWESDESDPQHFNDGGNDPDEPVSKRHQQGGIQGAFDGSVSYITFLEWTRLSADKNRNRLWCWPGSPDGRYHENP